MKYVLGVAFLVASIYSVAGPSDSLKHKPLRYVFSVNSSMSFCASCVEDGSLVAMPSTIHGIQYKNVRLGVGVGYTAFGQVRMMPYFGSLTFNLFGAKVKNGFFLQCDYGSTHAWVAPVARHDVSLKSSTATNFLQISTGYAYHYQKLRMAVQIGFHSLKTSMKYEYGGGGYNLFFADYIAAPPPNTTKDVELRRLFLSISFGL